MALRDEPQTIHQVGKRDAPLARPTSSNKRSWDWLGMLPFLLFTFLFMLLPSVSIFIRSFEAADASGFTFDNILEIFRRSDLLNAYKSSLTISIVTALVGGIFGFLLAYAITSSQMPKDLRSFLLTFCGVASNFAGVPLAFAFIATIGNTGLVTRLLSAVLGTDLARQGWSVYNLWGLSLVYLYFQFPLMVLVMAPALDGLRSEWREAAEILGGTGYHYWRYVALPILMPTFLGATILLFGNAFGAYATAFAFAGSALNLVPIVIGAQIQGDVLFNPGLGNALALGMILIMSLSLLGYSRMMRRASRWTR
jgi:putative spermidine/putrescine transport system permease protein